MTDIDSSWMDTPDSDQETELTEKQRQKLTRRAMNVAMYKLERSACTEQQIRDRLTKKEIPTDIIEETITQLVDMRYLDDENYAYEFARDRQQFRKQAGPIIKMELTRRGIDRELIDEALSTLDPDEEHSNAVTLVNQKLRSSRGLDRNKRTQRLVGMLARKGYNPGVAYSVVKEALDNEEAED